MKIQEIKRNATIAWSPIPAHPQLLATGTIAGTLGLDFDTSAYLELFSLELSKDGAEPKLLGEISASERFNKLCWGVPGLQTSFPLGLIAGGLSNGTISLWDPSKILRYAVLHLNVLIRKLKRGKRQSID
jgi:protein transport protein SEC31